MCSKAEQVAMGRLDGPIAAFRAYSAIAIWHTESNSNYRSASCKRTFRRSEKSQTRSCLF